MPTSRPGMVYTHVLNRGGLGVRSPLWTGCDRRPVGPVRRGRRAWPDIARLAGGLITPYDTGNVRDNAWIINSCPRVQLVLSG